jgi:spermidine synthase
MTNRILAFILGFSAFIVQLVLIREFLNIFMGNELVIGIMLALWMFLTASGALLGHRLFLKSKARVSTVALLVLNAFSPLAGLLLAVLLRDLLHAPGVMVPLPGVVLISLAGLAIFCLGSGALFTIIASHLTGGQKRTGISKVYAIEALGSLAGGLLFNFVLIYTMNAIPMLVLVLALNIGAGIWYSLRIKRLLTAGIVVLFGTAAFILVFLDGAGDYVYGRIFPEQEILQVDDTPYGKLTVTGRHGQVNFYLNSQPLGGRDDIIGREEKVHYSMCLHKDPDTVLMLSGGLDGSVNEVLKYSPSSITYVEPDPWALEAARKFTGLEWPENVGIHTGDPVNYLRHSKKTYDVILANLPAPSTVGNNRFYTRSFYARAADAMDEDGIFCAVLPPSGNYLNEELVQLYSGIYNTLKGAFRHIRIIPGSNTYFIASQLEMKGKIAEEITNKGIPTEYVNRHYIDDALLQRRSEQIRSAIDESVPVNTDFRPLAAFQSIMEWLSLQGIQAWVIALVPLVFMLVILLRMPRYSLGLFTSGFTSAAAEFLMIILFQVMFGFVYQMAGFIIMIFMGGLALGSGYLHRYISLSVRAFIKVQGLLGIIMLLIPLFISLGIFSGNTWMEGAITGVFTFVVAVLTGVQFHMATRLKEGDRSRIASATYSADLAGSTFGLFFTAVFIFPLLGIVYTAVILAVFNFLAAAVILWRSRSPAAG